ncbi:N/A [soil metagenome]
MLITLAEKLRLEYIPTHNPQPATRTIEMTALCDHDISSLSDELAQLGHNPIHAPRLLREYYGTGGRPAIERMPIARRLREDLQRPQRLMRSTILSRRESSDGTVKLLIGLRDGHSVEAVLMSSHRADRSAGCVSSQVGCAMGCDFCASTRSGLARDLDASEIVEQFLHLRNESLRQHRRLVSLVFMGMGEPMHNLDAVIPAIRRIADPLMGALGWRHVTVSTVGIVPGIDRLADADLGVHLAVSLHAPDDATRQRLVPTAKRYRVADILDAAKRYQARSGRITTIEYCLLAGVNDSPAQAKQLADLLRGFRAHVNLIPHNSIGAGLSGIEYARPSAEVTQRFARIVSENGAVVHVRRARGDDVNAACGQLREQYVQLEPKVLEV